MHCGRGPQQTHADGSGICPASTEQALDRVHGGTNAGRACWVVAGTFTRGTVECPHVVKCSTCTACDFYKMVKADEGNYFWHPKVLRRMIAHSR